MNWSDVLKYDETSPTGLTWVNSKCDKITNGVTPAGAFRYTRRGDPEKVAVGYNYKDYAAHRIIWEMFNGPIPKGMIIDHINGNAFDNRISNLKCKTQRHNSQNSRKCRDNSSGFAGVSWGVNKTKNTARTYAVGFVTIDGKRVVKSFSVNKLGIMQALKLAIQWRKDQIKKLNDLGNDYTERHGTL